VAVRCPFGYPAVVETRPYLEDGTPFPTLLYLTCPSAVAAIGRLEEHGGVEAFRRTVRDDPDVARALEGLREAYRERRRHAAVPVPGHVPDPSARVDGGAVLEAGIGGPDETRATCLHAYAAALLAAVGGWLGERKEREAGAAGATAREIAWTRLLEGFGRLWCDDERCEAFVPVPDRRAAIDVGTNSVRLLVADVCRESVLPIVREAEVTRLGEGLSVGASLRPEARSRTAKVVARYAAEARRRQAGVIRLAATSACRDAVDGADFVAELGREHSIEARVLTGEQEALLAYRGATLGTSGEIVLLDVGGGSTELVALDETGALVALSLAVGSVRGTEEWFRHDPPSAEERAAARRHVTAVAEPLRSPYGPEPRGAGRGARTLVGVAGTVTTLACLVLGLAAYDPDRIHLQRLRRRVVSNMVDDLACKDVSERAALPCMQQGRAEIIVAGGEIVLAMMSALGYDEIMVSERDMLDGIVLADGFEGG
jgi:exopolyphosphatase/guanosine-5'-triphosphate,3'-diphosphate pyrophosphatase